MNRSVLPYVTAGAALAGAGLFLSMTPAQTTPRPVVIAAVQLASFGAPLPLSPTPCLPTSLSCQPKPQALVGAAASPAAVVGAFTDTCGLICNGADGTEAHPNGQNGGLLIGKGGNGFNS